MSTTGALSEEAHAWDEGGGARLRDRFRARLHDRLRQVVVTLAALLCVAGTLVGLGVLGGEGVADAAGGAFAEDATHLAPASTAFRIWSLIYLGLLAYVIYQWLPSQTMRRRHRAVGWLAAASMLLNGLWLLVTRAGWTPVSVLVILALTVVLGTLVRRLVWVPGQGHGDALVIDATFGLYLGWVCIAVAANAAATLADLGWTPGSVSATVLACGVLLLLAGVGIVLAYSLRGRWAITLAIVWGLAWIAAARWGGQPRSVAVAGAAVLAAAAVTGATYAAWRARRSGAAEDGPSTAAQVAPSARA